MLSQVERTEYQHEIELKAASKKIRADQEKELRAFRESLKTELKLLKQEVDLMPKDQRKEALRTRKENLETDQSDREKAFLERLHQTHEVSGPCITQHWSIYENESITIYNDQSFLYTIANVWKTSSADS